MASRNTIEHDIAAVADDPEIRALDLSMFSRGDLLNMVLQRSEVLFDAPRPGRAIKAWSEGDRGPLEAEVDRLGDAIARRTAGVMLAEYRLTRETLKALAPRRLADIGCGYAMWDLFAARDRGCDVVLIDTEANEARHFGFADEGAAYADLATAREFLVANGVPDARITTLNPQRDDLGAAGMVDLAVSLISCGFHYPVATYLEFFTSQVTRDGAVLIDLRASQAEAQLRDLAPLGRIETLAGHPKARRVLLRKAA